MKYTAGPWDWTIEDYSMAILCGPKGEEDHVLSSSPCSACLDGAKRAALSWQWGKCICPSEIDARLIAAAPELYEALKEAQAALVEGGPKSPRDALWQKISNALARAEGKQ